MSSYRSRGVDRHVAEQVLAGAPNAAVAEPLAAVLRAAAAPARPDELVGEQAALAAFRDAAQLDHPVSSRSQPRVGLPRLRTVGAAVLLAVAASVGVAIAASTGASPVPGSRSPENPPVPTTSTHNAGPTSVPRSDTGVDSPPASGRPPSATSEPSSMSGLCQAYTTAMRTNPGKALDSPAFTSLITAAHGADNVPEYCAARTSATATHPRGGSTHVPTRTRPADPANSPPAGPPGRAHTPVNPAPGTATPQPSSGARPPSRGG
jgi:hypothetical protein